MKRSTLRITERENPRAARLEQKPTRQILQLINREDRKVAPAVDKAIPQIARAVDLTVEAIARGGRLIYLGAGTSGRLGVLDAAECIPTFGTDRVQAVMAGAPEAMFRPTEVSEDDPRLAVRDLRRIGLNRRDVLAGISASGRTPYTLGGMRFARRLGAKTIAVTANPAAPMLRAADVGIMLRVGPEIVAGSSRMKAGTAQKLVLNMISTATMVRLGRVLSGWMIHLQMKNQKLRRRGERILMKASGLPAARARRLLAEAEWHLPAAMLMAWKGISRPQAEALLVRRGAVAEFLRTAWAESARAGKGRRALGTPARRTREALG